MSRREILEREQLDDICAAAAKGAERGVRDTIVANGNDVTIRNVRIGNLEQWLRRIDEHCAKAARSKNSKALKRPVGMIRAACKAALIGKAPTTRRGL